MAHGKCFASVAVATVMTAVAQPATAITVYDFAGTVTSVPTVLAGAGIEVGDAVRMSITATLPPPGPDLDPAPSVGSYAGAISSWTLHIGVFTATGAGGDILVCNSPIPGQDNCGSANTGYGWWSGVWAGKDGVRFVTKQLTSDPIVLNGYQQGCVGNSNSCGNANVYNDDATALNGTGIPPTLDPVVFGSSTNNGRVGFALAPAPVLFSVSVVPEPAPLALTTVGLGVLGLAARRRRS